MRGISRILRTAFKSTVSSHEIRDHEAVKKEIARGIVRRTATGNVNLQRGRYLTKEDIEARLESAKGSSADASR